MPSKKSLKENYKEIIQAHHPAINHYDRVIKTFSPILKVKYGLDDSLHINLIFREESVKM